MVLLARRSSDIDRAVNPIPYPKRRLVDRQLEDVGPRIVADGVEIETGGGNLGKVEVGYQDRFAIVV
jgi:hypothetical protein